MGLLTVTVKRPVGEAKTVNTDNIEVAVPRGDNVTLVGLRLAMGPFATTGETVAVRLRVPVKPLRLISVIVEVPAVPAETVMLLLAVIFQSACPSCVTTMVTVAMWDGTPVPVPVTVMV